MLVINYAPKRFFKEIESLDEGTREATAHARMRFWGRAWRMFLDSPIVGKGIGQYPAENYNYRLPGEYHDVTDYLVCHSNWFQILSELGLLGFFCYFVIWYKYFKGCYLINRYQYDRSKKVMNGAEESFYNNISLGYAIGMIGFMVAGTFINIMIFAYYYNFVFFVMTLKSTWLTKIEQPIAA